MALRIKPLTLAIPLEANRVLLGMKKRGFGMGKWNGFGGKVEQGESIEEAARREVFEECGLEVVAMEKAGIHRFRFEDKPEEVLEVHVFCITRFRGEPQETEEMRPEWFDVDKVPFDRMWRDDPHWFPYFLSKKKFQGEFLFNKDGGEILEWNISES